MNTERLRTLEAVLETGSLSGAAAKLGYTPSGVSRMMETLEQETGLKLLVRGKNGVRPTDACQTLLPAVHSFLRMGESLQQRVDEIKGLIRGRLSIGNAYYGLYPELEKAIRSFQAEYPGIEVSLVPGITSELLAKLRNNEIDMALVTIRPEEKDFEWQKIGEDEMVAWVPENNVYGEEGAGEPADSPAKEKCKRSSMPDTDTKSFPIIAFETENYIDLYPGADTDNSRILTAAGLKPHAVMSTYDSYAAWTMVEAGLGVAMNSRLNSTFRTGSVQILPLQPRKIIEIGMASRQDPSPAMNRFLKFADEISGFE